MGALQTVARAKNADRTDAALAKLKPEDKVVRQDVFDLTVVPGRDERGVAQQIALLRLLVVNDWRPVYGEGPAAIFPETIALESLSMNDGWDPDTIELLPVVPEYLLRKYPEERLLTGSNMADDPRTIAKFIEMKKTKRDFMAAEWASRSDGYNKAHAANQAAAQELLAIDRYEGGDEVAPSPSRKAE